MRHLAGSFCTFGLGLSALCHAVLADSQPQASGPQALLFRTAQQTESHFAVAIKSQRPPASITRHLILVDTSASQTGQFRSDSLSVLKSLASVLPQNHLVQAVAVDSTFEPLSAGFVSTKSAEFEAAIQKLSERTPMGATDLSRTLSSAVALADTNIPTSLLYIGDGMSSSNLLSSEDVAQIVARMNDRKVSFHAVLLGPKIDTELSGILANQTGGTSQHPKQIAVDVVARELSNAISIAPEFVNSVTVQDSTLTLACPSTVALRSDRHTIVFGKGQPAQGLAVTANDESGKSLSWNAKASGNASGNEVRILFERAASSHGINSPIVGINDLQTVSAELAASVNRAVVTAQQLSENGETSRAMNLARRAARLAGGDVRLTAFMETLSDEVPGIPESGEVLTPPIHVIPGPPKASGNDVFERAISTDSEILNKSEERIQIRTQQLTQATSAAIPMRVVQDGQANFHG